MTSKLHVRFAPTVIAPWLPGTGVAILRTTTESGHRAAIGAPRIARATFGRRAKIPNVASSSTMPGVHCVASACSG